MSARGADSCDRPLRWTAARPTACAAPGCDAPLRETRAPRAPSAARGGPGPSAQIEPLQLLDPAQRDAAQPFDVLGTAMAGVDGEIQRLAPDQHQRAARKQI